MKRKTCATEKKPLIFHRRKIRTTIFLITLFAYPVLHWLIFWLYVRSSTIISSFQTYDWFTDSYRFVFLDNYIRIFETFFKDLSMMNAFKNSFFAVLVHVIVLPLCIVVSYAFCKKVPGEKIFRTIFYLPSILSTVVMTMCFKYMFNNNPSVFVGPFASVLNSFGIDFPGWNVIENPGTVWALIVLYCVWVGMGTNVIVLSSAMNRVPKELSEAARLEGCGYWRELFLIYIPLSMPTLSTLLITTVTSVFNFYLQPMFLTDENTGVNGSMYTISWYIFNNANGNPSQLIDTVTIGLIFSLFMLPFIVAMRKITRKLTPDVSF